MLTKYTLVLLMASLGLILSRISMAAVAEPMLTDEELEKNIGCVKPCAEEDRYLEVPWFTNLIKARAESQKQDKPMFLWIMNGHPLGCT